MALTLIGLGLKPLDLTLEGLRKIRESDIVYLETYTSFYGSGSIDELERLIGRKVIPLKRAQTESGTTLIAEAKDKEVCLLVHGNPLNATTHAYLLIEAKKKNVPFSLVFSASIHAIAMQITGLHDYKFGPTVTICFRQENFEPTSYYDKISDNAKNGWHTLCLLDIQKDNGRFLTIKEACEEIERIEGLAERPFPQETLDEESHARFDEHERLRKEKFVSKKFLVGLAAAGTENQEIVTGNFQAVKNYPFKGFPQSFIVRSGVNNQEMEAMDVLCKQV